MSLFSNYRVSFPSIAFPNGKLATMALGARLRLPPRVPATGRAMLPILLVSAVFFSVNGLHFGLLFQKKYPN